ncbi:ribosome-binding factor A [Marinitoga hydrogenitolerans DSM 16785]|uniref:Ribosome-binding factor A n=1 Tax=Marinitoga hydrogenitolerans (strain DSM 16785 / JCM 12826 / AT1271) TaxID=1122195 RepID=A0A1M4VR39_MARH1|nr:30S ribosome-binding factor RbfA [Marinitoga hydrogenitolerans]SHE71272.1 ribosome-binding factor A [Marinitoga hydrogenitolerans DSM 16785]
MAKEFRREMIESEILKLINMNINNLRDPKVQNKIISATRVELSRDKSFADIYISVLNGDIDEIIEVLSKAKGFFKNIISRNIRMYKIPEIRFHKDIGIEESIKIHRLLNEISKDKKDIGETDE